MKKFFWRFSHASAALLAALLLFYSMPSSAAPSAEVVKGLTWLQAQVQADGSLANETLSVATVLQNRAETLRTLKLLATIPTALSGAVASINDDNTEYLARQALSLSLSGGDPALIISTLSARQNPDGGFGGALQHESNALDTAWVLIALNAANSSNATSVSAAVNYLLTSQDTSGGYAVTDNSSQSYLTALVATALQASSNSPATVNALSKISTWLLSQQKADGSWGDVSETSVVYLALLGTSGDAGLQSRVGVFLLAQQGADGSWNGDPFSTALALRALVAQPRPVPTTGDIVGRVLDGNTGVAISGASAVIQGFSVTSDVAGNINFINVPAGAYTLVVGAQGYASKSLTVNLQAGATVDVQQILLAPAPTSGLLQGRVTEAVTGAALADVLISVTGSATASVLTAADGTYRLINLTPGNVTVSASKTGYASVGGTGAIVAGGTLLFSPALQPAGTVGGTTGSIKGQMVDAATQTPLAGVTVTVGSTGLTAASGADGRFALLNIPAGTYPIGFSLTGYLTRSLTTLISAGASVDFLTVNLSRSTTAVVVYGKLTDAATNQPIAQASVTALGTAFSAQTDANGAYRLEGLSIGEATLRFSAAGYASETLILSFPVAGEYSVDRALKTDQGFSVKLLSLTTDRTNYAAYAPVAIQMQVLNSGVSPVSGSVNVLLLDAQGSVLESLQATRIDANGVVQSQFDFQPGITLPVTIAWNSVAHVPGVYAIDAKIMQGNTNNAGGGPVVVLAGGRAAFSIDPTQAVDSLTLTPLPRFSNLGAIEQVGFRADVVNRSNIDTELGIAYQWLSPSGTVLYSGTATIPLLPVESTKSALLNGLQHTFTESGEHPARAQVVSGPTPVSINVTAILVAPGTRIDPSQSITPATVTPDGDKRIHIDIRLKGVEQK